MTDLNGQRWAITGAAGVIGLALRKHLAGRGLSLVSIDLDAPEEVADSDSGVACDVRDLDRLETAFAGCSGVVHLGGISDEADFHDLADVNIVGTYHVLEGARRAGVRRVVYASSNRVTGFYAAEVIVNELMPPRPDGFYGVSKVAGEALCRLYSDKFGLQTASLRIGSYEDLPRSQREMRTWLSPHDALRAFYAAMTTELRHSVFYAVSANSGRWWSTESGHNAGFEPTDNSSDHGSLDALPRSQLQGGAYAEVDYSLNRMQS